MKTSKFSEIAIIKFLMAAIVLLNVANAVQAQMPIPNSTQFDITGFLQEATLNPSATDPLTGGTLKVNGHFVVVPKDTIVILSANALTWQELFSQAPSPYGLTTAIGIPQSGLAMNDTPRPMSTYEVQVVGNIINTPTANLYVAGLIYISQEGLNTGAGFINYINYSLAEMRVGGRIGDPNTGTRVRINDPIGRFGRPQSPDPRWTVDPDNPTIVAGTGYPMGLPNVLTDPNLGGADDPLRPLKNRPKDTNPVSPTFGLFLTTFTFPANIGCAAKTGPDPCLEAPFEEGDFISFSGILVHDGLNPTAEPPTGYPNTTYISAFAINDNAALYTTPGTDPAYVSMEVFILEAGGTPALVGEIGKRTRFEGFSTDVSRNVHLFGLDVDPATGTVKDRDYGSIDVDCGLLPAAGGEATCTNRISGNAQKGRWRFRPPGTVLTGPGEIAPGTVSKANKNAMLTAFLPPTREVRAAISTGEAQSCSVNASTGITVCNQNYTLAPQNVTPNGIIADQYHAPILEYILPENRVGAPMIANNFETFSFLWNGGYTSTQGTLGGELNPFPIVWTAGMTPPYTPSLSSLFVVLANATIGVNGTEQLNALPLDQRFVAFPTAAVSFASSNPAATVNPTTGLVTGVFPGTSTITATATSGGTTVTGKSIITVTAPVDTFNLTVNISPGAVAETNVSSISLARGTSGTAELWVMSAAPGGYLANVNATSDIFSSVVTMTVNGGGLTSAKTTKTNTVAKYLLTITNTGVPTGPGVSIATISTTTTVIGVSPTISMLLPGESIKFNSTDPAVTWTSSNNSVGIVNATNGSFTAITPGNTTITATNATGVFDTALVIVGLARYTTPPLLTGTNLIIDPVQSDPALNASRLLQLVTAQNPGISAGRDAARWNESNQSLEKFDPFTGPVDFAVNADQGYFVNVSATIPSINIVGTLTGITYPIPALASITVIPSIANLTVGDSITFVAIPKDILGNPIAANVTWNSSNNSVGTIDVNTGLFKAMANGTVTINATNGTVTGNATVNVASITVPPVLTTITVTPPTISLNIGDKATFIATPRDQYGALIAATISWNSSNTTVGTIDVNTGTFTALINGTTTINATNGTIVGSAIATVIVTVPPILTTITVAPSSLSLNEGGSATFVAIPKDQSGNVMTVPTSWSSSNTTVGTIDPNTGLFKALIAGTTTINATNGSIVGNITVIVTPGVGIPPITQILTSAIVAPSSMSLNIGDSATFVAIGFDQVGNVDPATFTWSSSNTSVGIIDPVSGAFIASGAGTTTINATNGSVVGSATVTVNSVAVPPILAKITVTPATATLKIGGSITFSATATDQFGKPMTVPITWSSSNTTVGTIDPNTGTFTAIANGITTINATNGSIVGSAVVTVSTPVLTTITVTPATLTLNVGGSTTFAASATDQFGNPMTVPITWSSSNNTVGKIDPVTGLFTALVAGSTTINATSGNIVGSAIATVNAPHSAIRGTVYNDLNGNKILDPGEPGLSGWNVTNTFKDPVTGVQIIQTQVTDINGNYIFANLVATKYRVSEIVQPGFKTTTGASTNVDLPANTVVVVNFGNR